MNFNPNSHLMKLKNKDYLPVAARLIWFREEHPAWGIKTAPTVLDIEKGLAVYECHITDDADRIVSSGTKMETARGFPDFVEKAETGSVGRALGMLGYGTQFAPEFDEGTERIVDSPQPSRSNGHQTQPETTQPNGHQATPPTDDAGAPSLASLHGLATSKGKCHDLIHKAGVKWGVASSNDMTPGMRRKLWDIFQAMPDVEPEVKPTCADCGKTVTVKVAAQNIEYHGRPLCGTCAFKAAKADAETKKGTEVAA